jgi:hypothetical protein
LEGRLTSALLGLADGLMRMRKVNSNPFRTLVRELIPKLADSGQPDAMVFAAGLIEHLQREHPPVIEGLFSGEITAKLTCDHCRKQVVQNEKFTTLPLSMVDSRRILFSPWDLGLPIEPKPTPRSVSVAALFLGMTADGFEPFAQTGDYSEVWAFEMPALFDQEPEQGLALLSFTFGGSKLCDPIVMRAPLGVDVDATLLVHNRIEGLIEPNSFRDVKKMMKVVRAPPRFTPFPGSRGCQEQVIVEIPQGKRVLRDRPRLSRGPITLVELLNLFFRHSELGPEDQWRCAHCRKNSCPSREARIVRAPLNLIVQLKRFSVGSKVDQINTAVVIPERIDLSDFCDDPEGGAYEVRGIVHHTGTLSSGHYTAACKRLYSWYLFNDTTIAERERMSTGASESAYIVFLSKLIA